MAFTSMRLASILAFLLFSLTCANADWTFSTPEELKSPPGLEFVARKASNGAESAEVWFVRFSPKTHTFAVMDNPAGAFDTESASLKRGALAAVNGGYFHPDRTPLGLVIRQGAEIHNFEKAKLLSGLVLVADGRISIRRAAEYSASPAVREALQAGPFLVDGGKPVPGLENTRSASRTIVIADSTGRFGLLICKGLTLAQTAEMLAAPGLLPSAKITRALNLDGGSSTALWVRGDPAFYEREWKTVRNYLAIVPKS